METLIFFLKLYLVLNKLYLSVLLGGKISKNNCISGIIENKYENVEHDCLL